MLVTVFGRVTEDFELQISTNGTPYVRFGFAERIGYGKYAHTQYSQVWAWSNRAQELIRANVKKGSSIWVTGQLELEEYIKQDGITKDKRLKVKLSEWGYLPLGKARNGNAKGDISQNPNAAPEIASGSSLPPNEIDGDRDELPG